MCICLKLILIPYYMFFLSCFALIPHTNHVSASPAAESPKISSIANACIMHARNILLCLCAWEQSGPTPNVYLDHAGGRISVCHHHAASSRSVTWMPDFECLDGLHMSFKHNVHKWPFFSIEKICLNVGSLSLVNSENVLMYQNTIHSG